MVYVYDFMLQSRTIDAIKKTLHDFGIEAKLNPKENHLYSVDDISENRDLIEALKKVAYLEAIWIRYTKEEIEQANWLKVDYAWSQYYPEPNDSYFNRIYTRTTSCTSCKAYARQTSDITILPEIQRWKRPFLQLNDIYDEYFVSSDTKKILEQSDLTGFHFRDVNCRKTKDKQPNMHQLCVEEILPQAIIKSKLQIRDELPCPSCGTMRWLTMPHSIWALSNQVMEDVSVDIVKSYEYFGQGSIWSRQVFISQKFYKFLEENKLNSGFKVQPVFLE